MLIKENEKKWMLANKKILRELFERRVEELKDSVFDEGITTDDEKKERDLNIKFVQEFRSWLLQIEILESDKEGSKKENNKEDSFI